MGKRILWFGSLTIKICKSLGDSIKINNLLFKVRIKTIEPELA